MITATAVGDLNGLSMDTLVELIEIDASAPHIGGGVHRYCNETDTGGASVSWQGNVYAPFPILFEGLEHSSKDPSPRPTLTIGNVTSAWSTLVLLYQDMLGSVVTRRKVLAKYLDGKPGADTANGLPTDVFKIFRKANENWKMVQFELSTDLDLHGVMIPALKCNASHCVVRYRSTECGYTGRSIADKYGNALTPGADRGAWAEAQAYALNDEAYVLVDDIRFYGVCKLAHTSSATVNIFNTTYWSHDQCSKRFNTGCELRFDNETDGYPFLAFLGMTRLPV